MRIGIFTRRRRGTASIAVTALLATALTTIGTVVPASAAWAAEPVVGPAAGPIDPNTGYPFWYADGTGERFELCFDRPDTPAGLCQAVPKDPAARPWVDEDPTKSNLADPESFWYSAEAQIRGNGMRARFVAAQEATFGTATEAPMAGDQMAFGRVRVRLDGVRPGASYQVTQPYGSDTYVADDRGRVFVTEDIGCFDLPCDFTKPYDSSVATFLRWDQSADRGAGTLAPGYVGDPGVPHRVVGSPTGTNFFRVEGLGVGGPGVNVVETDLFSVQGKLWNPTEPMLGLDSAHNQVDFGKVMLNATAPPAAETLTLTNAGGGTTPLQFGALGVSGDDAAQFTLADDTCSNASLAPGATCTVDVSFASRGVVGPMSAQLDVPSNGKDSDGGQRILLRARISDGTGKDARVTGPISPEHGFPEWYQDETGTRVAICDDQDDPMCVLPDVPEGTYDPALPMSFPDNFPSELFWWNADAEFDTTNTSTGGDVNALLVLAQEAAFAQEDPVPGDQNVFGRIRIRVDGLVPGGSYTVATPYGAYDFVAEDDGRGGGEINYTEDIGCLETPCDFDRVHQSSIGPFLRQVGAPKGYLGDPNVSAPVTGGPNGNQFVISGPGVNGSTDLFAVSGKVLDGPPAAGGELVVDSPEARATNGQPARVTLTNIGVAPATPLVSLPDGSGFTIVSNGCTGTLAPQASCTVTVGVGGARPGDTTNLQVTNGDQQFTVPVRRVGGGPAAPSAATLTAVSDTGVSARDNLTSLSAVTVSGAAASGQSVQVTVDGEPAATVTAEAGTFSAQLNLDEGVHRVAAAYAAQAASAPVRVRVDRTAPRVEKPRIDAGVTTGSLDGTVTWSRGAGSGATTFEAQMRRVGTTFTPVALSRENATRAEYRMRNGARYWFRVRGNDRAGNIGAWAKSSLRALLVQERARRLRFDGRWARPRVMRSGDRVRSSARRGATATLRTWARTVEVVAPTGPNRGRAAILLNGRRVRTVDLYSPRPKARQTVATIRGLSPRRASTVQLRVLDRRRHASGNTRVALDAFVATR